MTYRQYPRDIKIETGIGPVALAVTERDHIYASYEAGHGEPRHALTVRGIAYNVSAHLHRWADGAFHIGQETDNDYQRRSSLFAHRADTWTPASEPARAVMATAIERAVNEWAAANPALLDAAQGAHVNNECDRIDGKIAELRAQIDALDAERAALVATV